jgi:hypothetical protein
MLISHMSPRKYVATLAKNVILLKFKDEGAAEAFDTWFEFRGGMEAFAAWVQEEQAEGKYPNVVVDDDTNSISWDDEEEDDGEPEHQ